MDRSRDIAIALLAAESGLITDGQLREALASSIAEPRPDAVTDTLVAKGFLQPHELARLRSMAATAPTVIAGPPQGASPRAVSPSAPTMAQGPHSTGVDGPARAATGGSTSPGDSTAAHAPGASEGSSAAVSATGAASSSDSTVAHLSRKGPTPAPRGPASPSDVTVVHAPGAAPSADSSATSSPEPPPSEHARSTWEVSDVTPPAAAQVYGEMARDAADADAPLSGRFSDYHIVGELGRGGMGVVYAAEQVTLGRRVALKVLPPAMSQHSELLDRFHTEARSAAKLRHPNIVQVYETGRWGGHHYIAMELVAGKSLHEVIKTERISPRRAATLVHALADALTYAHANGVIHRDVKPTNVIVGEGDHVFLMDFGLAREGGGEGLTQSGMIIGTPSYMPPEQAEGHKGGTDAQSDVYSLGATLYELLTGQPPFTGLTWHSILPKVVNEEPVPPRKLVAAVPRDLETIVLKAMEKTKARRYSSMASLRGDLKRWLEGEPIHARPVSIAERLMRKARKNRAATALGAAVLVVLLTAVGLWWRARERDWAAARERLEDFKRLRAKGDAGSLRAAWDRLSEAITLSGEGEEFLAAKADARYEDLKAAIAKEQYDVALLDLLKDADLKVGKYAGELPKLDELITGIGSLEIHTEPEGASFKIYDFNEKGLWDIQQSGDEHLLAQGTTPWPKRPWPMGEYLVMLEKPDCAPANYPVSVERNEAESVSVALLPTECVPRGMIYIPAGELVMPKSKQRDRRATRVESFLISETELTHGEYDRLLAGIGGNTSELVPQDDKGTSLWTDSHPPVAWRELPLFGITARVAARVAKLLGARLPTQQEFYRAAFGRGDRDYPWGNHWSADRVAYRPTVTGSLPVGSAADPSGVGAFLAGKSPFGCLHMLGNVGEWVTIDGPAGTPLTASCGGSYLDSDETSLTLLSLSRRVSEGGKVRAMGLRLALDVPKSK